MTDKQWIHIARLQNNTIPFNVKTDKFVSGYLAKISTNGYFQLVSTLFCDVSKMLWKPLMDLFCENSEWLIFIKNSVTEAPMTFWILQSCIKKPEPNFKWVENTNCFDIVSYSKISQNIVKWNMKSKVQFLLLPKSVVQIFTPLYDEDRNKELFLTPCSSSYKAKAQ